MDSAVDAVVGATDASPYTAANAHASNDLGTFFVARFRAPVPALESVCFKGKFEANTTLAAVGVGDGLPAAPLLVLRANEYLDECHAVDAALLAPLGGGESLELRGRGAREGHADASKAIIFYSSLAERGRAHDRKPAMPVAAENSCCAALGRPVSQPRKLVRDGVYF